MGKEVGKEKKATPPLTRGKDARKSGKTLERKRTQKCGKAGSARHSKENFPRTLHACLAVAALHRT